MGSGNCCIPETLRALLQAEQLLLLYAALGLPVEGSDHLPLGGGGTQGSVELRAAGIWSLQWYPMFQNNIAVSKLDERTKPKEEKVRKYYFTHHQDKPQITIAPLAKRMISHNLKFQKANFLPVSSPYLQWIRLPGDGVLSFAFWICFEIAFSCIGTGRIRDLPSHSLLLFSRGVLSQETEK